MFLSMRGFKIGVFTTLMVLAVGCSKKTRITKRLEGFWQVTSSVNVWSTGSQDKVVEGLAEMSYTFGTCDEYQDDCPLRYVETDLVEGTVNEVYLYYQVSENGDQLVISQFSSGLDGYFDLEFKDKNTVILSSSGGNFSSKHTLERQK